MGPVELLVVRFPGNQFTGDIVPALEELMQSGTIQVLDILFITKDRDGDVQAAEISELVTSNGNASLVVEGLSDLLTEEDVEDFGALLEPNSSAAMMLFENTWASRFTDALRKAKGEVLINERIPRSVVEEVTAAAA